MHLKITSTWLDQLPNVIVPRSILSAFKRRPSSLLRGIHESFKLEDLQKYKNVYEKVLLCPDSTITNLTNSFNRFVLATLFPVCLVWCFGRIFSLPIRNCTPYLFEKVLTFLSPVERNSEEKSQFLFLSRFISDASAACQAALAFIHDTRKQAGFGSGCLPSHH